MYLLKDRTKAATQRTPGTARRASKILKLRLTLRPLRFLARLALRLFLSGFKAGIEILLAMG
jgi:hypothetical protein